MHFYFASGWGARYNRAIMTGHHRILAMLILLAYLVLGGLYAVYTPAWQAPDEPAHYNYVRYVATRTAFPELVQGCYDQAYLERLTSERFPPGLPIDQVCYEFHQPPLYYLLAAPIYALTGGSLLALRLFSVALGAGVVWLALAVGRTIFLHQPEIGLGTMAFTALVPMHLAMLASVNNDALAELVLAALLLLLSRRLVGPGRGSRRGDVLLGILLGLGLLTKATVYIALPLTALTLWWARSREWGDLLRQAGVVFGLALLMALPWYVRNARLYGPLDPLGLGRHDEVVTGQLRTVDYLAGAGWSAYLASFVTTTFHSFWGQFGWMAVPMDGRTYLLLALLTLLALGGLIGWVQGVQTGRIRLRPGQGRALGLMAVTVGLMALGYGWYNLNFVQFQGRYLFPALIPLGLFFAVGLWEALADRWAWWLAGGLALALAGVVAAGVGTGSLDKWAVLWVGLAFVLAASRAGLAGRWAVPDGWLATGCYLALGLLALVSPFWFVVPYLAR